MNRGYGVNSLLFLLLTLTTSICSCGYQRSGTREDTKMYAYGHSGDTLSSSASRKYLSTERDTNKRGTYDTFTAGNKSHGVIFIEKHVPSEVRAGQLFNYSINVTNVTDMNIKDVELIETISHKFKVENSIPKMKDNIREGAAQWFVGNLGPRETKVIRITGIAMETGEIPFCTDIAYKLPPFCVTTTAVEPKLNLTRRMPSEVMMCDTIPVTFVVSNTGTGVARDIQIKETLPPGLSTVTGETNVIQEIGALRAGESREVSLTLKPGKTGRYTNTATATAEGGLSAKSNAATVSVRKPVLAITKTGPDKRFIGRKITYDIVASNKGDGPAVSTSIEDIIPDETSFVSASDRGSLTGKNVSWNLGTLQPQESKKVSVTLRAESKGRVINRAMVKAVCAEPVSASAITEILGIPAILLEVVDTLDPIEVNETEAYIITVTNQGSDVSTNIKITCTLEDSMQYVSSTGPTRGIVEGKEVSFGPLPTLAPKAQASWKVIIKALNPGDVRFKVSMIEDCLARPVEETEATNFYK
ncbi:MAG: DUF11 domain-containing protein [Candidatus Jettenia sp.]|uniref:DUF11 domain-containing protein n=1 Tax=Candidatus Jettenia caeni TaxID=247490 RepID=I3IK59_9BACT|nr:DUF11 domain-containing protein [Candidatus Jettenia sp. AMX1]MBC6929818.1 DUF11 domain-containing protein [Candidatus Jettenia sp.]WKZ17362.1 MAG: DUF11 domain-containing protein [Candidatus Jettenia caeni]KAA0247752.1 MAG: DUF11 domain-containing protein [Candidatus Jettenia sp. AMX1]MCE7882036.1 DUF11 domain-containing protein [Candidatus Jettenia sp. AMX1]MCQ3927149.1 DUF11 domain-containing protein [Candidatus Jettenia sp.]